MQVKIEHYIYLPVDLVNGCTTICFMRQFIAATQAPVKKLQVCATGCHLQYIICIKNYIS